MLRPTNEPHAETNRTLNHLTPEEAKFRDWLLAGSAQLNDNAYRDNPKSAPKQRPTTHADASERRVSAGQNSILFNLGNATGDTMELMPGGWKIASDPARAARRSRTVAGLPYPDEPSALPVNFTGFRNLLNLRDQEDWDRCLCWLLAALRPEGPYPILAITGPKASGKSTAALLLRSLIDPAQYPVIPLTSNERYVGLLAQVHWVLAFDNVRDIPSHISAAICSANRPTILIVPNDANWTPSPEIAGRALTINTRPLSETKQKEPGAIWWEFKNTRTKTLSALLTSVCVALGKQTKFSDLQAWLNAAQPAVNLSPAEIQAILKPVKTQTTEDLAEPIGELMGTVHEWTGTATKLLKALHAIDPASTNWLKTPREISNRINQSAAKLRPQGISMKFEGKGRITISR